MSGAVSGLLDQEAVRAYQLRRIKQLIRVAYDHTSLYREKYAQDPGWPGPRLSLPPGFRP